MIMIMMMMMIMILGSQAPQPLAGRGHVPSPRYCIFPPARTAVTAARAGQHRLVSIRQRRPELASKLRSPRLHQSRIPIQLSIRRYHRCCYGLIR